MTTRVVVDAVCDEKTEVIVVIKDTLDSTNVRTEKLQDGESKEFYVYDEKTISVWEAEK